LILIFLIAISQDKVFAQDSLLSSGTLRKLGTLFLEKGEYQLSYYYNYSAFLLEKDPVRKAGAAIDAVDACLMTGHYAEADRIIFDLDSTSREVADLLRMKYSYSLLKQKDYTRAGIYLSKITDPGKWPNQFHFMKAFSDIASRQKEQCLSELGMIDDSFAGSFDIQAIRSDLGNPKGIRKKHVGIALPLSAILPGLGQAYSGFYFDALQSFGLNAAFGIGAYASWKYELSKDHDKRNYILPSVSTLIFSAFYMTNLFNSVNVTQKANLYSEDQYFRKIADKFDVVMTTNGTFIRLKIKL
jgi:hypothetical protein